MFKNFWCVICVVLFSVVFCGNIILFYADVPNEIRYNGRLREYNKVVDGTKSVRFKIYESETGGDSKWEGSYSVQISSGIFSCILKPSEDVNWRKKDLYLELEIDGKTFSPREKLTATPFALHSSTAENIAVKQGDSVTVKVGDKNRLTITDTEIKFSAPYVKGTLEGEREYYMVPKGAIVIWSGAADDIPDGWVLCDGENGTPDLRGRFVLGAGNGYSVNATGGEAEHTLTIAEMPSHSHDISRKFGGGGGGSGGGDVNTSSEERSPWYNLNTGGGQPHNNMPPYYVLCYIMRK